MNQPSVEEWRARILAGWEKWGTGEPLDPRTVEHLAHEFAKPLWPRTEPPVSVAQWDGVYSYRNYHGFDLNFPRSLASGSSGG